MNTQRTNSGGFFSNVGRRLRDPDTRAGSIIVLVLLLIPVFLLGYMVFIMYKTPSVEGLSSEGFQQSTILYTKGGKEITRYYEENRHWVSLDSMSSMVPKSLVATEDKRFYRHQGIDVQRTIGAVFQTATGSVQGGSTITMQVVRNIYPDVGDDFDLTRKFKEWFTALKLEDTYSKEKILELYLNTVPFGYNTNGVEAAARTYFNTPAFKIDTLQAAQLVGMLKATSLYDPIDNPDEAQQRRNVVLDQLRKNGVISQADYDRLRKQKTEIDFEPVTHQNNLAPFFAEHARQRLGKWAERNGYNLYTSGLKVYTTLDAKKQKAAAEAVDEVLGHLQNVVDVSWSQASVPYFSSNEAAYARHVNKETAFDYFWDSHPDVLNSFVKRSTAYANRVKQGQSKDDVLTSLKQNTAFMDSLKEVNSLLQGGFTAMDPKTGYVRAWVGGRNFKKSQYDHVAQAERQPGSTFKPFVYSAALDEGMRPNDRFIDKKVHYTAPGSGQTWSPGNFGGESGQPMTLRTALAHSKNTVTSQLALELGPSRIADQARRMGIQSELHEVPSIALGTSPVNLQEMVAAYSVLADQGRYHKPVFIQRIESADGRVLAQFGSEGRKAISPATAYGTLDMMRSVIDRGTGVRIHNEFGARGDLAGKTGTTQNNADGWFMLLHPDLVMGAWVGFNSPQIVFRTRYWGEGAHNALKIVGTFFQNAGLSTDARFEKPASYVEASDSSGTLRVFADGGLRQEGRSGDTRLDSIGVGNGGGGEEYDFQFDTSDEETGSQDVSGGTFSTKDEGESSGGAGEERASGEQQQSGEQGAGGKQAANAGGDSAGGDNAGGDNAGGDNAGGGGGGADELESQPEPKSQADQNTREARENSQVHQLLEQQEGGQ